MTYTPTFVGRVQPFSHSYGTGNTDITISAVDINYAIVIASFASGDVTGFPCGGGLGYATLLNSTTVRIVQSASAGTGFVVLTVIELSPTLLRQPVQYGTVTLSGVTSNTVNLAHAVGPRAFLIPLGFNENKSGVQTDMASVTCVLQFSTTQVTAARTGTGGGAAPDIMVASYCMVDPK